ncbi:hypothetical protein evm_002486 [Chilo suppressalis]|nr:hypothetical protein evm_002486 [Chilo suppressalis]
MTLIETHKKHGQLTKIRYYFARKLVQPTKSVLLMQSMMFKNFGHKRQPVSGVTVLWHGFLTFTFIGLALKWDVIINFLLSKEEYNKLSQDISDQFNRKD